MATQLVNSASVPLQRFQIKVASQILAKSFFDDPAPKYYIPEDDLRAKLLPDLYSRVLNYALLYDEVYTTPNSVNGVALWMKPGHTSIPLNKMIRSGLLGAYIRIGVRRVLRALDFVNYAEAIRKRVMPSPHWYLFMIGVDPRLQGQGIGVRLLEPILSRADAAGLPCYLETLNPRTLRFYQRVGFHIAEEGNTPRGRLHAWFLVRNPQ
ncbi:MAG: GNAT family N-acetyltransferase [Chloroflexota bacterium]